MNAVHAADLAPPGFFTLHRGDARDMDALLAHARVRPLINCTITSPPYGELKDYGHRDQIGWGQPHDEYLAEMRRIFRKLHTHTREDGCLWVVADTLRRPEVNGGIWRIEPVPFQLSAQAESAGWILRDIIIWQKDKTLPWSGRGRLRNTFEYILLFVKGNGFKYYVDRLRDPVRLTQWWVKWPERYHPNGKVPTNLWRIPIPVQGSWKNTDIEHSCPLPPSLVERLITVTTDPGDVVFDPFAGVGVVVAEAERLGRRGLGIELVDRHVKAFKRVVRPQLLRRRPDDPLLKGADDVAYLAGIIPKLRALKYPRVLLQQLHRSEPNAPRPEAAVVLMKNGPVSNGEANSQPISLRLLFVVRDVPPGRRAALRTGLLGAAKRPPASKFGVMAEIDVIDSCHLEKAGGRKTWFVYKAGRTWMSEGRIHVRDVDQLLDDQATNRWPPILSNLDVRETPRPLGRDREGTGGGV